jgi:tetratricopeptide (TPR) repeat protein
LATHHLGCGWYEFAKRTYSLPEQFKYPDFTQAQQYLETSHTRSCELQDLWLIAVNDCWLGRIYSARGQYQEARERWTRSRKLFEALSHTLGIANVLYGMAEVAYLEREYNTACDYTKERLKIEENLRNRQGIASAQSWLGKIEAAQDRKQEACDLLQQAFALYSELKDEPGKMQVKQWMMEIGCEGDASS